MTRANGLGLILSGRPYHRIRASSNAGMGDLALVEASRDDERDTPGDY